MGCGAMQRERERDGRGWQSPERLPDSGGDVGWWRRKKGGMGEMMVRVTW